MVHQERRSFSRPFLHSLLFSDAETDFFFSPSVRLQLLNSLNDDIIHETIRMFRDIPDGCCTSLFLLFLPRRRTRP